MNKKSQAAMEFLMTYGWAIVVVITAIAALAYFGVLTPEGFMPTQCTFPIGISCLDFSAGPRRFPRCLGMNQPIHPRLRV